VSRAAPPFSPEASAMISSAVRTVALDYRAQRRLNRAIGRI
jgi:hypothetical protein